MFLDDRSWSSYRPHVAHSEILLGSISFFNNTNSLTDSVLCLWEYLDDSSVCFWIGHDLMVLEKCILTNVSKNISSSDEVSDFEFMVWLEVPCFLLVETWKIDTSWNENSSCKLSNFCEWSLNSVKNCLQNTLNNNGIIINS